MADKKVIEIIAKGDPSQTGEEKKIPADEKLAEKLKNTVSKAQEYLSALGNLDLDKIGEANKAERAKQQQDFDNKVPNSSPPSKKSTKGRLEEDQFQNLQQANNQLNNFMKNTQSAAAMLQMLGQMSATTAAALGGGGGSGGGSPPPLPGGGTGGGGGGGLGLPPGLSGGGGGGGMGGGLAKAALATGAGLFAAVGAALTVKKVFGILAGQVQQAGEVITNFSGEVAQANAEQTIRRIEDQVRIAGESGNDFAALIDAQTDLQSAIRDVKAGVLELITPYLIYIVKILELIFRLINAILDFLKPILDFVLDWAAIPILDLLSSLPFIGGTLADISRTLKKLREDAATQAPSLNADIDGLFQSVASQARALDPNAPDAGNPRI